MEHHAVNGMSELAHLVMRLNFQMLGFKLPCRCLLGNAQYTLHSFDNTFKVQVEEDNNNDF
ncbi:hypothetical protein D3C79_1010380 [compost metagenome]